MATPLGLINSSTVSTSYSTTLPSIVRGSSTERIAQEVLVEMRENFRGSYDTLPPLAPIKNLKENQAIQLYQKYGMRFIDYLQHCVRLESIRENIKLVCSSVKWSSVADSITSAAVALAMHRIGGHEEATAYAATQCALKGILTITHITVVNDIEKARLVRSGESSDSISEHSFLLLGVRESEFKRVQSNHTYRNKIYKILPRLKHGVILDPTLKLVCPVDEISTKGQALLQYTKGMPFVSHTLTKSWSGWELVLSDATRIFEIAQRTKFQLATLSEISYLGSQDVDNKANDNIPCTSYPLHPMVRSVEGSHLIHLHSLITKVYVLNSAPASTLASIPAPIPVSIPPSRIPVRRKIAPHVSAPSKLTLPPLPVSTERLEGKEEKRGKEVVLPSL